MSGLLSGLSGLGLDKLETMSIFEEPKEEKAVEEDMTPKEKDLVYDKVMECPVCGKEFTTKIMKTGKAKLLGTDQDLRPKYEGIDAIKYDVYLCSHCGYSALSRFFTSITSGQGKLIRDNISKNIHLKQHKGDIYSYEEALERYKLALANAIVKKAKNSERAYICLKSAWLLRGYEESLEGEEAQQKFKAEENEYLLNAFNGFVAARQTESFPMCGMDEYTIDYLLSVLAIRTKNYDVANKLISSILASAANGRTKDRARDLKQQLIAELKQNLK